MPLEEGPRRNNLKQTILNVLDYILHPVQHLSSDFAGDYYPTLKEGDNYKNSIVVRKNNNTMYYYDKDGNIQFQTKVATGANSGAKQKEGDNRTPTGKFNITQLESRKDPNVFGANKFYRLNTGNWTGIGIHGDANQPQEIGRCASHGCVRLPNDKLEEFSNLIGNNVKGTVVYILDENDQYKRGGILKAQSGTVFNDGNLQRINDEIAKSLTGRKSMPTPNGGRLELNINKGDSTFVYHPANGSPAFSAQRIYDNIRNYKDSQTKDLTFDDFKSFWKNTNLYWKNQGFPYNAYAID